MEEKSTVCIYISNELQNAINAIAHREKRSFSGQVAYLLMQCADVQEAMNEDK